MRKYLELAVMEAHGEISIPQASASNCCCQWWAHGAYCGAQLRDNPQLPPLDKVALTREICRAAEARDKAIRTLGLERDKQHEITALYSPSLTVESDS